MLDARQMNIFLVAAELENFSEAARQLNLSQPSVSTQIQSLERRLETQLFHRAGRHISLTESGQALLPLAREMVNLSIRIEESMASLAGAVIGHLKIGCSTTAGKYVMPRLITHFCDVYPQVQVTCNMTTRQQAITMLSDGIVHVAVTSAREPRKDVEYRHFLTDQVILIVSPAHPWAKRGRIKPQELPETNFILREETSGTRRVLEQGLAEHGLSVDQLQTAMILGNSEAVRTAVQERIGVAFVSRLAAINCLQTGQLARVEVDGLDLRQELYIGRNVRRPATKAQIAFWEFVHEPTNHTLLQTEEQES
jgi:DNA-binding transcriptional LysR family regulator